MKKYVGVLFILGSASCEIKSAVTVFFSDQPSDLKRELTVQAPFTIKVITNLKCNCLCPCTCAEEVGEALQWREEKKVLALFLKNGDYPNFFNYVLARDNFYQAFDFMIENCFDKKILEGISRKTRECFMEKLNPEHVQALLDGEFMSIDDTYFEGARTYLHKRPDTLERFSSYKPDLNVPDDKGRTPLHQALTTGYSSNTEKWVNEYEALLAYKGVDVNARDNRGWTPLFMAVVGGMSPEGKPAALVRCLLAHGADINMKDDEGKTVLARYLENHTYVDERVSQKPFSSDPRLYAKKLKALIKAGAATHSPDVLAALTTLDPEIREEMVKAFDHFEYNTPILVKDLLAGAVKDSNYPLQEFIETKYPEVYVPFMKKEGKIFFLVEDENKESAHTCSIL